LLGLARPRQALLTLGAVAFSAAKADEPVREYLDATTAASITVPRDSLVFARERSDLAANARDYLTLTPLEINRSGKREYFWSGYLWSTLDRRGRAPILPAGAGLLLLADGRPIPLQNDHRPLRDHGVVEPPTPAPLRTAVPVLFAATPEVFAYVARADELRVEVVEDGPGEFFALWKDARPALRAFSERISAAADR
ncbi:MAG: hypothetical protein ABI885_31030, partial [Gammaproteobacteria bacterium]